MKTKATTSQKNSASKPDPNTVELQSPRRFLCRPDSSGMCHKATREFSFTDHELEAISYILTVVEQEADQMEDSDPQRWAEHADAIDSLIVGFDSREAGGLHLNGAEVGALRFLVEGADWELAPMDEEAARGVRTLRTKLALSLKD